MLNNGRVKRSPHRKLRFTLSRWFKICAAVLAAVILFSAAGLMAQDVPVDAASGDGGTPLYSSINFDGRLLAGINGDSVVALSLTQGLPAFAYQLNSDVVYTNDFLDYSNSSFIKNETGFTGELGLGDFWKFIPQFEIANSTYGMFDNYYSRENKDSISFRLKTEYKPSPDRWDLDLSFARYDHSLKEKALDVMDKETFYKGQCVLGMEYIWSDANKAGFIIEGAGYNYPELYDDDAYVSTEFYFSFKITEFMMSTLTFPVFIWNRDGTNYLYAKASVSSINLKIVSLEFFHEYTLEPYRPEEFLEQQKYIQPPLDLHPSKVNHSELKSVFDFDFSSDSSSALSISAMKLKLSGFFENSSDFINYDPLPENVLSAETLSVKYINANAEFVTTFGILGQKVNVEFTYDYYRYYPGNPDINITYRPENTFGFNLVLTGSIMEINWSNTYRDEVYTAPLEDNKLDAVLSGSLDIHVKVYETFYIDSRINNLYNKKYSYREGYPEPGVQYYFGLRMMI